MLRTNSYSLPNYTLLILISFFGSIIFFLATCSNSEKKIEKKIKVEIESPFEKLRKNPSYSDWPTYRFETINVMYTPEHHQHGDLESFCKGYLSASRRITKRLGMKPYQDSIYIVLYTGMGQGRALTGQPWPFISNNVIHFWLPSYIGMLLTDLILDRWSEKESKNQLIYHGLRSVLDYTGLNYHETTKLMIEQGKFIPLDVLKDTTFYSDSERVQSAEAASFVAYLMSNYKPEKIKELYESDEPFEDACRRHLGLPLSQLQIYWMEFVKRKTSDSADSTRK